MLLNVKEQTLLVPQHLTLNYGLQTMDATAQTTNVSWVNKSLTLDESRTHYVTMVKI